MVTLRNPAITAVRLTDKNNIAAAIRHHDHQGLGIGNARLRDGAAGRSDEDTVGDVIHPFNERRLAAGPSVGERPSRLLSDDDVAFIVTRATTLPGSLGCPLTRWRIRKLVAYLARCRQRRVVLSRERLRLILPEAGVSFQRTRT